MKPDVDNLVEYFQAELRRCPSFYYDTDIFRDLTLLLPNEAFALIPVATTIVLTEKEPYHTVIAGLLLSALSRRSNTTEMPGMLERRWDQLIARLEDIAKEETFVTHAITDLRRWYRKPAGP